jgi:hypothetical protein
MTAAPNGNGTLRWQLWVSIASAIGGLVYAIVSYTVQIAELRSGINSANTQIAELQRRLDTQATAVTLNRNATIVLETSLKEVETQFCGADVVRNIIHANDLRIQAMLWRKVFGEEYPTQNAYYPYICNGGRGGSDSAR